MSDTLRFAEYVLTAALVFAVIALICDIVVLTSRRTVTRRGAHHHGAEHHGAVRARATVTIGAPATASGGGETGGGEADLHETASTPPSTSPGEPSIASPSAASTTVARRGFGLAAYATAFTVISLLALTVYLALRIAATGHGPFANQHEFAVSFAWGILVAYLVVEWRYRVRMLSVVVLPVAACLMLYAMSQDSGVDPLVPALQNNLLLTLHVGFAILAYGAACVSFGSAAMYLLYPRLKFRRLPRREVFDEIGYKAAVVTFPLLTVMIVLGAIWADTAWGRYWGWDPKETAALVTWLIYGAFLHARVVRGWRGTKSSWLLVIGFAAVLFAYFGNHFLGGLHSYV